MNASTRFIPRPNLLFLILTLFLIFVVQKGHANNYYVDPSSTVAIANGSLTNPWKTISQVNAGTTNLLPGDSVLFKKGQTFSGRLIVYSSGTAAFPIVYAAYGIGAMPELTYTGSDIITITNKQHIVIDGLKIIDKTMPINDHTILAKISYAITLQNAPYCTIKNCEITLVGIAIAAQEGSDFTTIESNYIHNLRAVRNTVGGDDDYGANAMVIGTSGNLITNNKMEDCWATSYDYGYDGGAIEFYGSTISDNKIMYNTALNCNGFLEVGSGNYGIATNDLVAYNKIINCGQTATFHNKLNGFAIRIDNLKFYNNVIVETKKQLSPVSALFWYADPTKIDVVSLKNNIIWLTTGQNVVNNNQDTLKMTHSNNIYLLRNGILGVKLGATELLASNSTPLFRDTSGSPENWDYRPVSNSAAIDFGADLGLTRDYLNNPIIGRPEAGIIEIRPTRQNKFYIDPSSKNTYADGSFSNPWKTLDQANAGTLNLQPGDSVFFKRSNVFTGQLNIINKGTLAQPIVYTSYGIGNIPILTNTSKTESLINIVGSQYIQIIGLKLIDNNMNTTDHAAVANINYGIVLDRSTYCLIRNCEISLLGIGIATKNASNNTTIEGNNISNMRAIINSEGGLDDYGANGMVIGSVNNLIQRNVLDGCWANSFDYGFIGGAIEFFNSIVNDNKVLYNTALNCNGFLEFGSQSNGEALNNLIGYNKIINCGQTAVFHNKIIGNYVRTYNNMIYNNVIIENKKQFTGATDMFFYEDPTIIDVVILKNNIIWMTTGENVVNNNLDTTKMIHTNNLYKLRNSSLGVNLDRSEVLVGNISVFVDTTGDPLNWDLRLLPGSLGINLGTNVGFTQDYIGNPIYEQPDAGIYEYIPIVTPRLPRKFYANPSSTSIIEDGTINNPWKSIASVNNGTTNLVPGDSVFFKSGEVFNGGLIINSSGFQSKPIVYTYYTEGPKPIITSNGADLITISNHQYVEINGLELTDKTMNQLDHSVASKIDYGILLVNAPNCTISNCTISLVGVGIATQIGSDFSNIINNYIYNLRAIRNSIGGEDDYGANGIVVGSSSNHIYRNRIEACWSRSYDYGFIGGAIEFYNHSVNNNTIMYNAAVDCDGFIEIGGASAGSAINNLFAYNKIINCGPTALFHNKINNLYFNTNNTRIFNNVIVKTKEQFNPTIDMFWFNDPTQIEILVISNNIILLATDEKLFAENIDTTKVIHTNNIYKISAGNIGINLDKTELSFLEDFPIFIETTGDAATWDYRPIPNSPAINFGSNVGFISDYVGNAIVGNPDAGIFEYQRIDTLSTFKAVANYNPINCYGGSTTILIEATGGTPPYIGTGNFISAAGQSTFIVRDAVGSMDTVLVSLSQPDSLQISAGYSIFTTETTTTSIYVTAIGGTAPYTYQIDNGPFQSSNVFTNKTAGIYTITVKDAKGCTRSLVINLLVTTISSNFDRKLQLIVAPNPSYATFTVSTIKYRGSFVTMNLKVYNAFGQIVYTAQGRSDVTYTFGANFIPGNYVLVATVEGTVQAVKLIRL